MLLHPHGERTRIDMWSQPKRICMGHFGHQPGRKVMRRVRSRFAVATTALAVVLTSGLAFGTPIALAAPTPDGATPGGASDPQRIDNQNPALLSEMRKQEKLAPAAQALLETARKLPADSGYAGVAYEDDGVSLYFKGSLPEIMAAAVNDARRTAAVTVKNARHSRAELQRVQDRITAAVEKGHSDIQAIGVAEDGSGLVVEKMPAPTASAMRTALAKKGVSSTNADALLAGLRIDVPVTMKTAAGPIELLSSREDDFAPWNGGGQYEVYRDIQLRSTWCTTGFGVMKGGQSYVLTAAHCMSAPDVAYNNHLSGCCFEEIGPVYQENWDKDILLINARGSVLIFDGGVNSSYTKTVHSWDYRVRDELLCTSGSKSGVICGDKTDPYEYNIYGCDSDNDCFTMHDLARANNVNGQCVGTPGDSGGPVFSLDRDGVRAKGTITAMDSSNCSILYFQDMDEIVGSMGATPRTA
ncbi:trypsin-like serine protease [Planosporangium flavigriseum]